MINNKPKVLVSPIARLLRHLRANREENMPLDSTP